MIPSPDVMQLTLTLNMTTAHVVETSVTVNNNSPVQDYVHPDDQTQPTFEMTPGFKPFTHIKNLTHTYCIDAQIYASTASLVVLLALKKATGL